MQRFTGLGAVPAGFGPSVVTIGNFDGVHRGHQAVLASVVDAARRRGLPAVAVTFEPHPVAVLHPERAPAVLTGTQDRLRLLGEAGLDAVLLIHFTPEFARWSPERFVQDVFVDALHAQAVVVGRDTRFGYRNSGDLGTLRLLGEKLGFDVELVEEKFGTPGQGEDGEGRRWSSTWVRELLAEGDVAGAARVLGRPHRVVGVVVHGDHRGRELGYPTANLAQDAVGQIPADGVYAGRLIRPAAADGDPRVPADGVLPAAISIGTNPTFDGTQRRVEAYVLDRDDLDLYGEQVALEFVERLRPTLRFDGVEALVEQMGLDVARCRELLGAPARS